MRDLLLTAIVVVLLPFCFTQPWIGFLGWTWIGTMNPHRIVFGYARELPWAMMLGGATLVGLLTTKDKKPVPWNLQLGLMVVLLVYFTFTTLFAWAPEEAWDQWTRVMKVVVMAIIATKVIYSKQRIRWLLLVIALSVGYYGIKGGIWVIGTGGSERVHGPTGSFISQSNGIGLGLLMVIPLMFALAREEQRRWLRLFLHVSVALCILSVFFTYSRGAMLGMAATAPFLFMRSKRKFRAAMILVPFLVAGVMFAPDKLFQRAETIGSYEEDTSSMQRIQSWTVAWNIALEKPLTGAGFSFESFPSSERWLRYGNPDLMKFMDYSRAAHSVYFQILGHHGFVALALFLWLMLSTIRTCNQLRKRTAGKPELEWIGNYASAIRICLIGYMVSGAFLSTGYFDLAWVYCTFTAILSREMPAKPVPAWREPAARVVQEPGLSATGSTHGRRSGA